MRKAVGISLLLLATGLMGYTFLSPVAVPTLGQGAVASPIQQLEFEGGGTDIPQEGESGEKQSTPEAVEQRQPTPAPSTEAPALKDEAPEEQAAVQAKMLIRSIGFTAPLMSISLSEDGSLTPPDFIHAYVWDEMNHLESPEAGTSIIVMHSLPDGSGLGNAFFNQATSKPLVKEGELVEVAGKQYGISSIAHYDKETLPTVQSVWEQEAGKLVLITCLQKPDGSKSTENYVITARLV